MADIDAFEYPTDDQFDELEQGLVERALHKAFGFGAGGGDVALMTDETGATLDLHVSVIAVDAPQWIVHVLRRPVDDDHTTTWRSVWASTDVFAEHEWVPGGEELDCAECGAGLAVHRDPEAS